MKKLIFILIILLSTKSFSQDRRICERDYVNTALTEMNLGIIGIVIRDKVYPKNDNFVMQAHVEEHNGQYLIGIDKYTNQHKR